MTILQAFNKHFDTRDYSSAVEHFVDIEGVTGSIPVSPTISTKIKYVRNNKDLACKLLKLLSYFYYQSLKRIYLIPNTFLKNRSKLPKKSIKVSCKCLVKISRVHRDRAKGSQEMSIGLTGLCLFLLVHLKFFFICFYFKL